MFVKIAFWILLPVTMVSVFVNVLVWHPSVIEDLFEKNTESVHQELPQSFLDARFRCTATATKGFYRAYSYPYLGSVIQFSVPELLESDVLKFRTKYKNGEVEDQILYMGVNPVIAMKSGSDVRLVSDDRDGKRKTTIEISKTNGFPGITLFIVMEDNNLFGGITFFDCKQSQTE